MALHEWYVGPDAMLSDEQKHHVRVMEENAELRRIAEGVHRVTLVRTPDEQPCPEYLVVDLVSLPDMLQKLVRSRFDSGQRHIRLNLSTRDGIIDEMLGGRYMEIDPEEEEADREQAYLEMLEAADAVHGTNLAARTEGWEEQMEEDDLGGFPGYPSVVFDEFLESLRPVQAFAARATMEAGWQTTPDLSVPSATTIYL